MSHYSFKHKNERPWPNERLGLGVIVGHTTPTTTRIWVRTNDGEASAGDYLLLVFDKTDRPASDAQPLGDLFEELRDQPIVERSKLKPFDPRPIKPSDTDADTTCVLDIEDLEPNTTYSYAIWSRKACAFVLGHDKRRRFRTPAEAGGFSFGLISCHNPFGKSEEIDTKIGVSKQPKVHNMGLWETARLAFENEHDGTKVDFVIAGGDQAYSDGCDAVNIWDYLEKIIRKRNLSNQPKPLPTKDDMISWFRDMYQGYWGFPSVRAIFGRFPTYMIWDDHEIRDGWGSHKIGTPEDNEIDEVLFADWEEHLTYDEAKKVLSDMFDAAKQAYFEYEHSHNPRTDEDVFDYSFRHQNCLFYVLDGRGYRNIDRDECKILGREQLDRFRRKIEDIDKNETPILFVVSAVPLLHGSAWISKRAEGWMADKANVTDDLRDAWEYGGHTRERAEFVDILFGAAQRGVRVCVLSGDVHMSAVFRLERNSSVIYQLTSSAITYNTPAALGWFLEKATVAQDGQSEDGYTHKRLLLESDPSFAIIVVSNTNIRFQLYRDRHVTVYKSPGQSKRKNRYAVADTQEIRLAHSAAKIDLDFGAMP